MMPLVSIVIPTYNRARDLARALGSVMAQTCRNWEALVIDNHSDDGTAELVRKLNDPRIKLFEIHNQGVIAASRNLGIRNAMGEYVAFLDSDDWWAPQKLEESLKYLEQGADLVYHNLFIVRKAPQTLFRVMRGRSLKSPIFADLIRQGNSIANSSVVVRKRLLVAIGGLSEDPNLIAIEDFDAWLRAAKVTEKFTKIPITLGYYWAGGGNVSNPRRSLRNLSAFEERYAVELQEIKGDDGPWWINFVKARAHYLLSEYVMAEEYLRRIQWKQISSSIAIKILWMKFIMAILRKSNLRIDGK